jgi:hypothetical protein
MKKRNWPTAYRACTESKAKECWLARGGLENLMKTGLAGWLAGWRWCYTPSFEPPTITIFWLNREMSYSFERMPRHHCVESQCIINQYSCS